MIMFQTVRLLTTLCTTGHAYYSRIQSLHSEALIIVCNMYWLSVHPLTIALLQCGDQHKQRYFTLIYLYTVIPFISYLTPYTPYCQIQLFKYSKELFQSLKRIWKSFLINIVGKETLCTVGQLKNPIHIDRMKLFSEDNIHICITLAHNMKKREVRDYHPI